MMCDLISCGFAPFPVAFLQMLMSVGSLKAHAMKMQSVLTLKEAMSVSARQDMREMDTTAQVKYVRERPFSRHRGVGAGTATPPLLAVVDHCPLSLF